MCNVYGCFPASSSEREWRINEKQHSLAYLDDAVFVIIDKLGLGDC